MTKRKWNSGPPLGLGCNEVLGAWLPIATAPRDGTMVLVNDTTPGYTPWVAANYMDGDEWAGWVYDDATTADSNPLGPKPTHWLPVPPLNQKQTNSAAAGDKP